MSAQLQHTAIVSLRTGDDEYHAVRRTKQFSYSTASSSSRPVLPEGFDVLPDIDPHVGAADKTMGVPVNYLLARAAAAEVREAYLRAC